MFGPDKCGTSNARTHVIFNYPPKGDDSNLLIKKDVKMEKDQASHIYTLHVKPDATFEVRGMTCVGGGGGVEKLLLRSHLVIKWLSNALRPPVSRVV